MTGSGACLQAWGILSTRDLSSDRVGCPSSSGRRNPPGRALRRGGLRRRPGDVFSVELAVAQAAVEDADQPVGQYPQRLLVALFVGALEVVVASGARRRRDRREGPQLAHVREPVVANEPGQHHPAPARGLRDGRGASVVLTRPTILVAVRIVTELRQCPGAEDRRKSWQTEVDLGVRVYFQSAVELLLQLVDLHD